MTHSASGWTEAILHNFSHASGSYKPRGGLIFDSRGNLYGTTLDGGNGGGTAYKLTSTNGSWAFNVLYAFSAATGSYASLTMDAGGNLYGTLVFGEQEVFRLTPSDGQWTLTGFNGSVGSFGAVFEITPYLRLVIFSALPGEGAAKSDPCGQPHSEAFGAG